jgi:ATP-dependent 26S proteasome regulatory subunit
MSLLVAGATNRAHALDAALRRPGRMDREIVMHPPAGDLADTPHAAATGVATASRC